MGGNTLYVDTAAVNTLAGNDGFAGATHLAIERKGKALCAFADKLEFAFAAEAVGYFFIRCQQKPRAAVVPAAAQRRHAQQCNGNAALAVDNSGADKLFSAALYCRCAEHARLVNGIHMRDKKRSLFRAGVKLYRKHISRALKGYLPDIEPFLARKIGDKRGKPVHFGGVAGCRLDIADVLQKIEKPSAVFLDMPE